MKQLRLWFTLSLLTVVSLWSCNQQKPVEPPKKDTVVVEKEEPQHHEKWSYTGENGPENWAKVDSQYVACGGQIQSPIDIVKAMKTASLKDLVLNYQPQTSCKVLNNGHSLQVSVAAGSNWTLDKQTFEFLQYHFHCPSEHTIAGESFPMEGHMVHSVDGKIAVIGILFKEGAENPILQQFIANLPDDLNEEIETPVSYNPLEMFPKSKKYYHYVGSLTTPPCTEGVQWYVMKTPVEASAEQIAKFAKLMPANNARPVQPLNGRPIKEH